MKTFRILSIAAVAIILAACGSDDSIEASEQGSGTAKVPFTATIGTGSETAATRTVYTESGKNISVAWKVGDKVALIHNGKKDEAEVTEIDAEGNATIKGSVDATGTDGEAVTVIYPAAAVEVSKGAEYALNTDYINTKGLKQDGTLAYIAENLDFRLASGTLAITSGAATLSSSLKLASQIAVWKLSFTAGCCTPFAATSVSISIPMGTSQLQVAGASSTTGKSEYYICVVPTLMQTASSIFIKTSDGTNDVTLSKSVSGITAGKFFQSDIMLPLAPEGLQEVDLGLPSGTKWANMNIGAEKPEDKGVFFAWGEVTPKTSFTWDEYKYYGGLKSGKHQVKKYCIGEAFGTVDNLTALQASDDAATQCWGDGWCTPTFTQLEELITNPLIVNIDYAEVNGVVGCMISKINSSASLFLPAAGGYGSTNTYTNYGTYGNYWSSTLATAVNSAYPSSGGAVLSFTCSKKSGGNSEVSGSVSSVTFHKGYDNRCLGYNIRPVRKAATSN